MENRAEKAMEANRRYVQAGLNRRKLERQLDAFECEMIQRVNKNCEDANWQRKLDLDAKLHREARKCRIVARAEQKCIARQMRKDTVLGILAFFAYAVVMMWLPTWTYLPVCVAIVLVACGVLFLAVHMIHVHGLLPTEDEK